MAKSARRLTPAAFPDLFDWLESPWTGTLPFTARQTFRIEGYTKDNHYIVRAELPGMDPDKDIEVSIDGGILTIHAERREEQHESRRSEFRYGSLTRSIRLPSKADAKDVTARYDKGILEVSVPIPETAPESHRVAIEKVG